MAGLRPAMAQTEQGFPSGIWTFQDENASISTAQPTDRNYVNGFSANWTSNPGAVPAFVANLGHALWGDGTQRISLGVMQQIFTPTNTTAINPPLNDEPYAGYLVGTFGLIQDTATVRNVLSFNAGVVGRDAGAEIVQNDFHSIIGQKGTHGWAYQLPSEPAFDAQMSRTWRLPLAKFGGLESDVLPQIAGAVGTTQIYVEPAVTFRIGQGLNSDFGAPLLNPGPSGGNAYQATRPFVWYVFGGVASKFVGYDEFLQGSDFQTSRHVDPYRVVGQGDLGVAIIWRGLRFSYTQVFQTRRYYGEVGSVHEYGSFAVSGTF
ncbi:MAG TPA: lipid A deacylase LpxR family protein [Micropepsaceae bacterium]|nr:lipid A deacylase LpxR family protein [Micropepsaceae bacterium]